MADYTVIAPDGKEIVLEGPDNASDADILKAAEELYKPQQDSGFMSTLKDAGQEALGAAGFGAGLLTGVGKEALQGFPEGSMERIGNRAEDFAQTWEEQNKPENWKAGANAIAGLPGQAAAGLMAVPGLAEQAIFGEDPRALKELNDNFERRAQDWSWTPYKDAATEDVLQKGAQGFQAAEENITDSIVKAAGVTDPETQTAVQAAVRYVLELGIPGELAIRHIISKGRLRPTKQLMDHIQGVYDKIEYERKVKAQKDAADQKYTEFMREIDDQDPTAPQYGRGDMSTPPELDALNREAQAPMQGAEIPEMSQKATRAALREAGEGAGLGIAEVPPERTRRSDALPFEPTRSPEDRMADPTPEVVEKQGVRGPERVDLAKSPEILTAAKSIYEKIERALRGEKMAQRWKQRGSVNPRIFKDRMTFRDGDQVFTMHPGEIPASVIERVGGPVSLDFVKNNKADHVSMSIHEKGKPVGYVVFKKVGEHLEAVHVKMKEGYHGADKMYSIFQEFADIDRSTSQTPAGFDMWERWREQGKTTRDGTRRPLGGTGKKGFGQGGALSLEPIRTLWEARKARKKADFDKAVREEFGDAYTQQAIDTAWDMLRDEPVDPVFAQYHNEEAMRNAMGKGLEDYSSEPPAIEKLQDLFQRKFIDDMPDTARAKFAKYAVSGLGYLGRITNHPLIKAGGIATTRAHYRAQAMARQWIGEKSPLYHALKDLRKSGLENKKRFLEVLKENEGLKDLTPEDLKRLDPKVARALEEYRKVSKQMYDALKAGNDAYGLPTAPYRQGWAPGIFKGRYYISGTIEGKNAGWFWADSAKQLKKMKPELERMYPDMKFGEVQDSHAGRWERAKERGIVMMTMDHIMQNFDAADPRMNQIRQQIQALLDGQPMKYVGRHGKFKTGVEGAQGFEANVSTKKNFDNFASAFLAYAENLAKYAEYGKMDAYIKDLTDPTKFRHQAEAQAAIKAIWERNFLGKPSEIGAKLNVMTDAMSDLLAHVPGLDHRTLGKINQISKKAFFSIIFGFYNLKFITTQMVQPVQFFSAAAAEIAAKLNSNPAMVSKGVIKGFADNIMSVFNKDALSPEMKDAMRYAEKNGVFDPMFIEQFETFGESLINNKTVEWATGAELIRMTEAFARRHFFIQAYHVIKEAGIKDAAKAADLAAAFTNEKMVNYAPQFKPLMYTSLGPVGQLLSPLTTFKHNYYSQMVQLLHEAHRSGMDYNYLVPVAMMVLSQIIFAGVYGMPLVQEYEGTVDILKKTGVIDRTSNVKLTDLVTNPQRLKNAGFWENLALTGVFNAALGLDFQASFAAAEMVPSNIAPVAGMAYELWNAYNKENSSGWEAVMDKMVPRGPLRYLWEQQYTDEQGNFYDPKKKQHPLVYRRGPKEQNAALLGARTVEESYARHRNFENERRKDILEKQKSDLTAEIKQAYRFKDQERLVEAAKKLVQLPGGEDSFKRVFKELTGGELTPQEKTLRAAANGSETALESLDYLMGGPAK